MNRQVDPVAHPIQIEWVECQTSTPGVVQHGYQAAAAGQLRQPAEVGKFHRDRAGCLQPDQLRSISDCSGEGVGTHRVIETMRDPESLQLLLGKRFARSVRIAGDEHLVAGAQQAHVHQRDRGEPTRHEKAMRPTFQGCDSLLQGKSGRRSVQAVGVATLVFPIARQHRPDVREKHRRRFMNGRRWRIEAIRRAVCVVDKSGSYILRLHRQALFVVDTHQSDCVEGAKEDRVRSIRRQTSGDRTRGNFLPHLGSSFPTSRALARISHHPPLADCRQTSPRPRCLQQRPPVVCFLAWERCLSRSRYLWPT